MRVYPTEHKASTQYFCERMREETRMGAWKVSESMSSDAIAQHFPPFTSSAHCASASPGACLIKCAKLCIIIEIVGHWKMCTDIYDRHAHQREQLGALLRLLFCHAHSPATEFVLLFRRACVRIQTTMWCETGSATTQNILLMYLPTTTKRGRTPNLT